MHLQNSRGRWALAVALPLIVAAQLIHPSGGLPVYDGFVTEDSYRYLDPPAGELGNPSSFSSTVGLRNGTIPDLVATTDENPPQAQIFAPRGTFKVPAGASEFTVSIAPIEAPFPAPAGMHFVGNVYTFIFTTSDGRAVPTARNQTASVVLRGVLGEGPTTINRLEGSAWKPLPSHTAGGTLQFANVTTFGTFVMMANGTAPSPPPVTSPVPSAEPSAEPTSAGSPAPTALPLPTPSPVLTPAPPTGSPQPSPTPPSVVPQGSGQGGLPLLAELGLAGIVAAVIAAVLIRRRRSREQDWRPYR